jgi:hypothetical protein
MCLTTVERLTIKNPEKERVAYKVFCTQLVRKDLIRFPFYFLGDYNNFVKRDKWLIAYEVKLTKPNYVSGFHIFLSKKLASKFQKKHLSMAGIVVKIKAKGIHTVGRQDGFKTYVVRKIFVPKDKLK